MRNNYVGDKSQGRHLGCLTAPSEDFSLSILDSNCTSAFRDTHYFYLLAFLRFCTHRSLLLEGWPSAGLADGRMLKPKSVSFIRLLASFQNSVDVSHLLLFSSRFLWSL